MRTRPNSTLTATVSNRQRQYGRMGEFETTKPETSPFAGSPRTQKHDTLKWLNGIIVDCALPKEYVVSESEHFR